jgi:hypothetical protein
MFNFLMIFYFFCLNFYVRNLADFNVRSGVIHGRFNSFFTFLRDLFGKRNWIFYEVEVILVKSHSLMLVLLFNLISLHTF